MEGLYVGLILVSLFLYLHIALTYVFSVKYLSLLSKSENYNVIPMSLSFAGVCVFTGLYFSYTADHWFFPYAFNLTMLSVMVAKCFYFKALGQLLEAKLPLGKIYTRLTIFYALLTVYFMADAHFNGLGAYFDLTKPELSGLALRERLLPFEIKSSVKALFLPNYVLGFVFYCYLAYLAFKKGERLILFGVVFTIGSILFTNSYHLFKTEYWIPLNIVADLFEMLRVHWIQRGKLESKVVDFNRELLDLNQKLEVLEKDKVDFQVYRHDLRNDLYVSSLHLHKAKLFLKKAQPELRDMVGQCLEDSLRAQKMASEAAEATKVSRELALDKQLAEVCSMQGVLLRPTGLTGVKLLCSQPVLKGVLVNLIKNAKEANLGRKIEIKAEFTESGEGYTLRLNDGGDFQKIADPKKIFERGFSTKSMEGRGLGLYSVKTAMQKLGGDVSLENERGEVCFRLFFPKNCIKFFT